MREIGLFFQEYVFKLAPETLEKSAKYLTVTSDINTHVYSNIEQFSSKSLMLVDTIIIIASRLVNIIRHACDHNLVQH